MATPVKKLKPHLTYVNIEDKFVGWDVAYAVDGKTYIASIFSTDLAHAWECWGLLRSWDIDFNKIISLEKINEYWFATFAMFTLYNDKDDVPKRVHLTIGNIPAKLSEDAILHITDIIDWGTLTGGSLQLTA